MRAEWAGENFHAERVKLQDRLTELLHDRPALTILEAGCGAETHFEFPPQAIKVGIDLSEKQLERNQQLKEKIHGDIQQYQLPAAAYDAINCWYVLEHLPFPERALANFAKAVKPGGLIILALPNVTSMKGLITKFSPHWFHVFYYRYIMGVPGAGKDQNVPFRTYLRFSISPANLARFAEENNFTLEFFKVCKDEQIEIIGRKYPFLKTMHRAATVVFKVATLGQISADRAECLVILRKR